MNITHLTRGTALAALLSGFATHAFSQAGPAPSAPPAPTSVAPDAQSDAAAYARDFGVSAEEARRRLTLQTEASNLGALLQTQYGPQFSGIMITHKPEFSVSIGLTSGADAVLASLDISPELRASVTTRATSATLQALDAAQASAVQLLGTLNIPIEAGVDLPSGRVKVYAVMTPVLQTALRTRQIVLPELVDIVSVPRLGKLEATVVGGRAMVPTAGGFCTSGFTVRNASSVRGVTTSAHCPNAMYYESTAVTFQAERQSTSGTTAYDIQWHTTPGQTVTNQINTGSGNRSITATRARSAQNFGAYTCKYGWASGYTCGTITANNYTFQGHTGWVYVDNTQGYANLSDGGDSGAPWYLDNIAFGIHAGSPAADDNDAIFMPVDNFAGLSLTVLTAP